MESQGIGNFPESLWTLLRSSFLPWQLSWECFVGSFWLVQGPFQLSHIRPGFQEATGHRQAPPQGPSQRGHLPRPQIGQENRNLCHLTLCAGILALAPLSWSQTSHLKAKGLRFPKCTMGRLIPLLLVPMKISCDDWLEALVPEDSKCSLWSSQELPLRAFLLCLRRRSAWNCPLTSSLQPGHQLHPTGPSLREGASLLLPVPPIMSLTHWLGAA